MAYKMSEAESETLAGVLSVQESAGRNDMGVTEVRQNRARRRLAVFIPIWVLHGKIPWNGFKSKVS